MYSRSLKTTSSSVQPTTYTNTTILIAVALRRSLLVILHIDNSLGPLPCGHLAREQNVNLAVRAVLHLRQEEVRDDEAEEARSGPNVTALAAEVGALVMC
jgi:hypothetical protein